LGLGFWGFGFGVWVMGPNPQSPIPNPQSPIPNPQFLSIIQKIYIPEKIFNNQLNKKWKIIILLQIKMNIY